MVRILLDRATLPAGALDDPAFWYIGINDENHREIYRRDIPTAQLATLPTDTAEIVLFCELQSGTIPASWAVWPVSESQGWLTKLEGPLGEDDYTIVLDGAAE